MGRTFTQIRQEIEAKKHEVMKKTGCGSLSFKMRKGLKVKHGQIAQKHSKIVEDLKKKLFQEMPSEFHTTMKHPVDKLINAMAEHLAGETLETVETKYELSRMAVSNALKMWFPTRESREEALANILLNNAITSSMIFAEKATELTAKDAAVSAGIFTERYTGFKKAQVSNFQPETPVAMVLELEKTLQRAATMLKPAKVIELTDENHKD